MKHVLKQMQYRFAVIYETLSTCKHRNKEEQVDETNGVAVQNNLK